MKERHRIAVTGIGTISPGGSTLHGLWHSLFVTPIPGHHSVKDWDPSPWLTGLQARHTDRFAQFAVAAAEEAAADAGPVDIASSRAGVVIATALGGIGTAESQAFANQAGSRRVSPYAIPMIMPNSAAAWVSIGRRWRGPCETITTACAAGTDAIGRAAELIANNTCDVVLAGGAEAAATPMVISGFSMMRALSTEGVLRPFDENRDGFVVSEGATILQLENWRIATSRGTHIYGEILGWARSSDGYDVTAPLPDGTAAAQCIESALAEANVRPQEVSQVNAHGTGTRLNDRAEAEALGLVFSSSAPPVTSIKGATGHAFGASGALELASVLLSMQHHRIPPTVGIRSQDRSLDLDVVAASGRPWEPGVTISNSFGFGGHNSCVVVGPGSLDSSC